MIRSRLLVAAFALLPLLSAARTAHAQATSERLDAVGTLDYTHGRAAFRVGAWVKYHVSAKSDLGAIDDYTVTQIVAGEEEFWGEDCFWLETWVEAPGKGTNGTATLMSYGIFDDSLAPAHVQLYVRKKILGLDENDKPIIQPYRLNDAVLKSSNPLGDEVPATAETLGTETVKTPKGDFVCRKIRLERVRAATSDVGDSTQYTEGREVRVTYATDAVPLTRAARIDLDTGYWRRTWLIGRSKESGPLRVYDRSRGTVELVDFGTGGLTPQVTPEYARLPLAEQRALARKAPAPLPPLPARPRRTPH